jgi:hypothetical protein
VTADSLSKWDSCRPAECGKLFADWSLISALWGLSSAITVSARERSTVGRSWASCAARVGDGRRVKVSRGSCSQALRCVASTKDDAGCQPDVSRCFLSLC